MNLKIGIALFVVFLTLATASGIFLYQREQESPDNSGQSTQTQMVATQNSLAVTPTTDESNSEASFTKEELAAFTGKNGSRCYVAVDGVVYDMTESPYWQNGTHITSSGRAFCGADMSELITLSPHGTTTLSSPDVLRIGLYLE